MRGTGKPPVVVAGFVSPKVVLFADDFPVIGHAQQRE
jgi:hypothetical protein